MYWPNLKSVAFPVPEIIGGTQKNWEVPGYAHSPFSQKFFMGYYSDGHCYCSGEILGRLEVGWENGALEHKSGNISETRTDGGKVTMGSL